MQKGNKFSLGAAPRITFQQTHAARLEFVQFGNEVFDLITDVMQSLSPPELLGQRDL